MTKITTDTLAIKSAGIFNSNKLILLLMALPFTAMVLLFSYVPLFGWIYAFFDYKPGIKLINTPFVGFKYFMMALDFRSGSELFIVLRNTLVLSFLGLAASPLPVAFAIFLSEMNNRFFKKFIQTVTTLPNFISWVIVYAVFFASFSIEDGFVNQMLLSFKLIKEPLNILANAEIAWFFQLGVGIWKGIGFGAIMYMAAIAGIDTELYDAVKVDGGGRYRKIMHIVVPGILPTFIVLLLLSVSNMLSNGFEQYYVFMNAIVKDKLQVFDYYVYRVGLTMNEYSLSTALGMFKTIVSVSLLFSVNWLSKRLRGESII